MVSNVNEVVLNYFKLAVTSSVTLSLVLNLNLNSLGSVWIAMFKLVDFHFYSMGMIEAMTR